MSHVKAVTKQVPREADAVQDFLCYTANAIASVVEAKGGVSPIVSYVDEKCDIPVGNP